MDSCEQNNPKWEGDAAAKDYDDEKSYKMCLLLYSMQFPRLGWGWQEEIIMGN